jgi:hypothetical protein
MAQTLVLRLNHFGATAEPARTDERLYLDQRCTTCNRGEYQLGQASYTRIKHPLRDLQQTFAGGWSRLQ